MEKQVPLNPDRNIKGGIYARYSPGRTQKERSVGLAAVRVDDWDNLTGRDTPTFSSEGKSLPTLKEDNQNERQCNQNTRNDDYPDC